MIRIMAVTFFALKASYALAEFKTSRPIPTTRVTIAGNLDASETGRTLATLNFQPSWAALDHPAVTDFQVSVDIIDQLGGLHEVKVFFAKVVPGTTGITWLVRAFVDGSNLGGGVSGEPVQIGSNGEMVFGLDGFRIIPVDGSPVIAAGTPPSHHSWFNGTGLTPIDFVLDFTSFDADNRALTIAQNGLQPNCGYSTDTLAATFARVEEDLRSTRISRLRRRRRTESRRLYKTGLSLKEARGYAVEAGESLCAAGDPLLRIDAIDQIYELLGTFRRSFSRSVRREIISITREETSLLAPE